VSLYLPSLRGSCHCAQSTTEKIDLCCTPGHARNSVDKLEYLKYNICLRLYNEYLYDLCASPNIIRLVKSGRMRWAGHVARIGDDKGVYMVLMWRPDRKRALGTPCNLWANSVQMLQEACGRHGLHWLWLMIGAVGSRPVLRPTQPATQWVPGSLPGLIGRGVALTTHPHLGPRFKKE
jgi:hypothetical protein